MGCGGLEIGSGVGLRWAVDLLERFMVWNPVDCCGWRMWWPVEDVVVGVFFF